MSDYGMKPKYEALGQIAADAKRRRLKRPGVSITVAMDHGSSPATMASQEPGALGMRDLHRQGEGGLEEEMGSHEQDNAEAGEEMAESPTMRGSMPGQRDVQMSREEDQDRRRELGRLRRF